MSGQRNETAGAVLQRLLLVLPLATREEGVRIDELAHELDVDPHRVLGDLKEVESRSYYLPAGLGDQIQLTVTRERLNVWTTGQFQRPVRLTPREALALELALRVASHAGSDTAEERKGTPSPPFQALQRRLVAALRTPSTDDSQDTDPAVAMGSAETGDDPHLPAIRRAVRTRREIGIRYRRPGREVESRRVAPLLLAHAEGRWYVVARDQDRDGLRIFRVDRVLEVSGTGRSFTPDPADLTAAESFLQDGRILGGGGPDASEPAEAVVEYSHRIARWVRERRWDEVEELPDGGLRVRHQVFDPEWLVRHVLSYGTEAKLLEPEWLRERLVAVLERRVGVSRAGPR